jgi:predicted dinucleotide-binding enzyme
MKIGILGSGVVAQALAGGFLKHGHDVAMGTRTPDKLKEWSGKNPGARIAGFPDAAKFGEVVVLAVKGNAAMDALRLAGAPQLAGKTVLDESLMERLQGEFGGVHFVKAFNSVGNAFMVNPQFRGGKPTMFICGNDEAAKRIVKGILDQFGWETADMGKAEAARAIEPLCMLWCIPGFLRNEWSHAFKLLT